MGRIGEPAVGEGIGGEEITEFVIPARLGNADQRDQSCPHDNDAKSNGESCEHAALCKLVESGGPRRKKRMRGMPLAQNEYDRRDD